MKRILYTLFLITAIASCKKDDTLRYNNITMGNIDGESIISDQGNVFNISEKAFEVNLHSFESGRVILSCDVLRETSDRTYDIRLTGIREVLTKNVKRMEDSTPQEDLNVNDPVVIRELWYAGGYLNMGLETAHKTGSETSHYINLVLESSEQGKYTFSLRHNAQGEVPAEGETGYSSAYAYVSFPVAELITEDSAKLTLKWKSHKFSGSSYSLTETEDIENEYDWTRGGHEHAPRTLRLSN